MCITAPAKIISVNNNIARVKVRDKERQVKCVMPNLKSGDWVLVNADLAVDKVSAKEAREIGKLMGI